MRASSTRERMLVMSDEIARLAIETLMRIVGEANGVEIETILRGKKNDEKEN